MDEGLIPIWGPDGESILSFALQSKMLLPTGKLIRKPKITPEPNADTKKPTMIALEIDPKVGSQYGLGPSAAGQANEVIPDNERHITLAYLGEIDELERKRAHDFTRRWLATGDWSTLQGRPQGFGTFISPEKDKDTVLWMSWDIPGLTEMQTDLFEALKAEGFSPSEDHGFVPHETIAYMPEVPSELPEFPTDIPEQNFKAVVVAEDDTWTSYDFPMAMALRGEFHTSLVSLLASSDGSWEGIAGGEALVAAGGLDRNRGNAEQLRRYWTVGPGGAKIRWNTPGDWKRCVRHLSKHLGPRAKGYCQLRHREVTGLYTGDMKHRMLYGWGGKPASYWQSVAKNSALVSLTSSVVLSLTSTTPPPTSGGKDANFGLVVTPWADTQTTAFANVPSSNVLSVGDRFKVFGEDAVAYAAEVVDLQAIRDRPEGELVGQLVRSDDKAVGPLDSAVTLLVRGSDKEQAA